MRDHSMRPSKVGRESLAFSVVGEHLSVISRLNAALDKKTCCMWPRELDSARCHNRIARPNGEGQLTTRGLDTATLPIFRCVCGIAFALLPWLFPTPYGVQPCVGTTCRSGWNRCWTLERPSYKLGKFNPDKSLGTPPPPVHPAMSYKTLCHHKVSCMSSNSGLSSRKLF